MSISINGFKINVKSFDEMHNFLTSLREDIKKAQKKHYLSYLSQEYCVYKDKVLLGFEKEKENKLLDIKKYYLDQQREVYKTQMRNPLIDISFSLSWFYYRKKFYAIFYAEQPEISKVFTSHPKVENYNYYNHSDPPKGISYSSFKQRLKVWDKIIPSGIPSQYGYNFDLNPNLPEFMSFHKNADLSKYQPKIKYRVKELTLETLGRSTNISSPEAAFKLLKEVNNPSGETKKIMKEIQRKIPKKYSKKYFEEKK